MVTSRLHKPIGDVTMTKSVFIKFACYIPNISQTASIVIPIRRTKTASCSCSTFSNEKEKVCSKQNTSLPSFPSHCVMFWLHHSGNKQLDRYRWVKFIFCSHDIVLSFLSRHVVSQTPIAQLSQFHILHTHCPAGCDFCELQSIQSDCLSS